MKIKKFNAVVAVIVVTAAVSVTSFLGYTWSRANDMLRGTSSDGTAVVQRIAGELSYSQKDHQVTNIPWQSFKDEIPGKTTLVKWADGNRVYYQITGPINKDTIEDSDYFDGGSHWGENTEMEVFFSRGGDKYDQWLLNPKNAQILHFKDTCKFDSSSDLPSSRYVCEVKGDELITTFWCHKHDTPGNIVFNYNPKDGEKGSRGLAWATTGLKKTKGQIWNHHDKDRWTHP
ncbi:MAG: hypothetical protein JXA82_16450 [Sedimentisphaerales bacterium]|nr:hypothetical protein [Sedimentisphaerales bacterium]